MPILSGISLICFARVGFFVFLKPLLLAIYKDLDERKDRVENGS